MGAVLSSVTRLSISAVVVAVVLVVVVVAAAVAAAAVVSIHIKQPRTQNEKKKTNNKVFRKM